MNGQNSPTRRRRLVIALAVSVAVVGLGGGLAAAATGGSSGAQLDGGGLRGPAAAAGCPDPGTATPVVLVHGLNGSPGDFTAHGEGGVARAVTALPGVAVSYFDYQDHATQWVTDPHIGPALARDVVCLADRSASAGGPGKVVVIAHSMGGLALREAAAMTVDRQPVAGRIALAVTIATPNTGSWIDGVVHSSSGSAADYVGKISPAADALLRHALAQLTGACAAPGGFDAGALCAIVSEPASPAARAMVPGSPQLAALPVLPAAVPRYAVAGNVMLTGTLPGVGPLPGVTLPVPLAVGDWLVKPDSALAEARGTSGGGGSYTATCTVGVGSLLGASGWTHAAWHGCSHGGLLYDPAVTARVVKVVTQHLHR